MREDLRPPATPPRRHFISIKDVTRDDVERLLATARTFERSMEREVKKLPTLKGRLVINVFYESSTRTSSSFELAAKRLSADTMSIKSSGSSVDKGESLKDTAITLGAYDPDVIVIRHPQIGAPRPRRSRDRGARRERRRREASASDAGAPRPLHDARVARPPRRPARRDRRRRPALPGRALADPGARTHGRTRHARRAAGAPAARHRGDGLRDDHRHQRDRWRRRRLRPAHAARADAGGRELRAVAARVHRALGRDAGAAARRARR